MVHRKWHTGTHIHPLSTWERLISPPIMGRSLIDVYLDMSPHPFFYLLAHSSIHAGGRMVTLPSTMHTPFTSLLEMTTRRNQR